MHILLTDVVTCPRCGPEFGLILLADRFEERRVMQGRLGCPNCREEYEPSPNERRQMEKTGGVVEKLYRPKGCSRCRNLGFGGRIGIYELFVPDDQCVELISTGASLNALRGIANSMGMATLLVDGIEKVKAGITTLEEVFRVTA